MNRFLLFFLLIPVLGISQVQIGEKIEGELGTDTFARSIAMSADGNIIAAGAPNNSNNGSNAGHVRVYENIDGEWVQVGDDIEGEAAGDISGERVALSADGTIIAISSPLNNDNGTSSGHVRVFENINGIWSQVGIAIEGDSAGDQSGGSIALSADGSIIAIGAPYHNEGTINQGQVRVFENINGVWTLIGNPLVGLQSGFGYSVALSSDANIMAVGANGGPSNRYTMMFQNVSGTWTQIGQVVEDADRSISLSSNGNIVAIAASYHNGLTGQVRIYQNIAGTWTQIGQEINGENSMDSFGQGVSLSSDGTIIAIGAGGSSNNFSRDGHVKIYKNTSNNWVQIGIDIIGDEEKDYFGETVALSAAGDRLIVGATTQANSLTKKGYVKVYDLTDALSTDNFAKPNFNIYPNPAKDIIHVALEDELQLENVVIYNNLGQKVQTVNQSTIDVTSLAKGLYFIEVHTNQGKASKKVVIE